MSCPRKSAICGTRLVELPSVVAIKKDGYTTASMNGSQSESLLHRRNKQVTLLKFYLYKIAFDFKEDRIHTIKYILTTFWRVMD